MKITPQNVCPIGHNSSNPVKVEDLQPPKLFWLDKDWVNHVQFSLTKKLCLNTKKLSLKLSPYKLWDKISHFKVHKKY